MKPLLCQWLSTMSIQEAKAKAQELDRQFAKERAEFDKQLAIKRAQALYSVYEIESLAMEINDEFQKIDTNEAVENSTEPDTEPMDKSLLEPYFWMALFKQDFESALCLLDPNNESQIEHLIQTAERSSKSSAWSTLRLFEKPIRVRSIEVLQKVISANSTTSIDLQYNLGRKQELADQGALKRSLQFEHPAKVAIAFPIEMDIFEQRPLEEIKGLMRSCPEFRDAINALLRIHSPDFFTFSASTLEPFIRLASESGVNLDLTQCKDERQARLVQYLALQIPNQSLARSSKLKSDTLLTEWMDEFVPKTDRWPFLYLHHFCPPAHNGELNGLRRDVLENYTADLAPGSMHQGILKFPE